MEALSQERARSAVGLQGCGPYRFALLFKALHHELARCRVEVGPSLSGNHLRLCAGSHDRDVAAVRAALAASSMVRGPLLEVVGRFSEPHHPLGHRPCLGRLVQQACFRPAITPADGLELHFDMRQEPRVGLLGPL